MPGRGLSTVVIRKLSHRPCNSLRESLPRFASASMSELAPAVPISTALEIGARFSQETAFETVQSAGCWP